MLTDKGVKAAGIGRHGDGGGLYLEVKSASRGGYPEGMAFTLPGEPAAPRDRAGELPGREPRRRSRQGLRSPCADR
jgi:hypothetical protein